MAFLARIAASGVATAEILDWIGLAVSCDDAHQGPDVRGRTRAPAALGRTWSVAQLSAVRVLGEIGLPQLPAHVVARLRELATQDRRIVDSGHVQAFIHDDDELRAAILDLIGDAAATALSSALWITRPWWPT